MEIRGLGYVGFGVADTTRWRSFAESLGAMVTDGSDAARFNLKIDDRPFRIAIESDGADSGLRYAGWEVSNAEALLQARSELDGAGYRVEEASDADRAARQVRGMIRTTDPGGFAVEIFWGPILDHEPFVSPMGTSGFVTGDMGLGHIVMGTTDMAGSLDFYLGVLGFRVSDLMAYESDDVVFMRCNQRHHSLALMSAPRSELYHFMLEVEALDDVGYTLDRLSENGTPISRSLGRHTNDRMVSFYGRTPSGFDVEYGCGGIRVDDAEWSVSAITKASLWGHHQAD